MRPRGDVGLNLVCSCFEPGFDPRPKGFLTPKSRRVRHVGSAGRGAGLGSWTRHQDVRFAFVGHTSGHADEKGAFARLEGQESQGAERGAVHCARNGASVEAQGTVLLRDRRQRRQQTRSTQLEGRFGRLLRHQTRLGHVHRRSEERRASARGQAGQETLPRGQCRSPRVFQAPRFDPLEQGEVDGVGWRVPQQGGAVTDVKPADPVSS
eukprot:scaffold659_cov318-Pavlova_lutheri.AAC.2